MGSELFLLHDTHGFPLSESIIQARMRGLAVDLFAFARAALAAGWTSLRTQGVIRSAIAEADASCPL